MFIIEQGLNFADRECQSQRSFHFLLLRQGVTQKIWEDVVLNKLGKIMYTGHRLTNRRRALPTQLRSISHCVEPDDVSDVRPLVGMRSEAQLS